MPLDIKQLIFSLLSYQPLGPDSEPLGGFRGNGNDAWVPIREVANDWVNVKTGGGSCLLYSATNPENPLWGLTGEGSESFTRDLACCAVQGEEEGTATSLPGASVSGTPPTMEAEPELAMPIDNMATADEGEAALVEGREKAQSPMYQTISEKYKPKFFDRSKGWKGQTYDEALSFCADFNHYMPCPYDGESGFHFFSTCVSYSYTHFLTSLGSPCCPINCIKPSVHWAGVRSHWMGTRTMGDQVVAGRQ